MTTPNEIKPAAPAETLNSGRCAVDAGFGNSREKRLARIAHAESLGYVRWAPYVEIGIKKPRWYWKGGHYDFDELPLLPNGKAQPDGCST